MEDVLGNRGLFTVGEAAEFLRISLRKLFSLTKDRDIACVRIGRGVRYAPQDLQAWIRRHRLSSKDENGGCDNG